MTRRLIRKRELTNDEPIEETIKKEEVVESEPIIADLKVSGEKLEEPVEEPKEVNFEFQKDYFFGTPSETADKQTEIDALPIEEPKPERTVASLSRAQFRIFQRTGKLPN